MDTFSKRGDSPHLATAALSARAHGPWVDLAATTGLEPRTPRQQMSLRDAHRAAIPK